MCAPVQDSQLARALIMARGELGMRDTGAAFKDWALKDDGSQLQPAIARGA
jgi:hypothetical protein